MKTVRTTKVRTKMRMIVAAFAFLVMTPGHSQGQGFSILNGKALAGVTAVDANVTIENWLDTDFDSRCCG